MPKKLKLRLFKATVESVLLYGAECWTLTKRLEQKLDGCYTRMLMRVQNMNWKQHHTLSEIYGNLPRITSTIQRRRLHLAGHWYRRTDQIISKVLLWQPTQGKRKRGRPYLTYVDQLVKDTGLDTKQLSKSMSDRDKWKVIVNSVSD